MAVAPSRAVPKNSFYRPVHQAWLAVILAFTLLLAAVALYTVHWIFLAAMIGIGLGVLVTPLGSTLHQRFKIPRALTSIFSLIVVFGVLFLAGYFMVSMISEQITPLSRKSPQFFAELQGKVSQFSERNPWIGKSLRGFDPQKYFGGAAEALFLELKIGASAIAGAVFIFFIALYFSIRPDSYFDGFISAFPKHRRLKIRSVMKESAKSLRGWFRAQLTVMLVVGAVATLFLKIAGSPHWGFFGAITGVLELVPYFGPVTAFATVSVITLAADPGVFTRTAIALLIVLFLEGHLIVPLIMKGSVKLPPVYLLILLAVMGTWFGALGFLMAAPTLAVLRTLYIEVYRPSMDRQRIPPSETSGKVAA